MFSLCPSGRTPIEFTWSGGSDCALDPAHRRIFQRGFLEVAESIRDHLVAAVNTLVDTVSREQTSESEWPRTSTTDGVAEEVDPEQLGRTFNRRWTSPAWEREGRWAKLQNAGVLDRPNDKATHSRAN